MKLIQSSNEINGTKMEKYFILFQDISMYFYYFFLLYPF